MSNPQRAEQRTPPKAPARLKRPNEDSLQETVIPAIPKEMIPDGMDYNWKRSSYLAKEDKQHQIRMGQYHWHPVPYDRHDGAIATEDPDRKIITNGGLVLMERPMYLSQEAADVELRKAHSQVDQQYQRLKIAPPGTETRGAKAESRHNLSVPDDAGRD